MEGRHDDALRRIYEADRTLRQAGDSPQPFELHFSGGSFEGEIDHPSWDVSWATPSGETIDDLDELGLLRVEPSHNKTRRFALTMKGRGRAEEMFEPKPENPPAPEPQASAETARDPRKVAVMHGRDLQARQWMFDWLRRVGLQPLEWGQLVELTGKATPYNGEAVEAAFTTAQAVVVLITPDELGGLHPDLVDPDGQGGSGQAGQARLNVILEAGMAFQSHPAQTILVEIGATREISDLAGRNTVRLTGDRGGVNTLASRLEVAGCTVDRSGNDWLDTSGLADLDALRRREIRPTPFGGVAATGVHGSVHWVFRVDGRQVEGREHGSKWSSWTTIGELPGEIVDLAASSLGPDEIEVFALLESGEVFRNWWRDGDWQAEFTILGHPFPGDHAIRIAATSKREGHQEVFVETADGSIGNLWWEGRWHRNNDAKTRLNTGWWRF